MSELQVEHPNLNVGELVKAIKTKAAPIRRSTHVGNKPPRELVIMTALPSGVEVIEVDSIQGNDNYSDPRSLRLAYGAIRLCEGGGGKGRVVGSVRIDRDIGNDPLGSAVENDLACKPKVGEFVSDFHTRAIMELNPTNPPERMSNYFASQTDIYRAVLEAVSEAGHKQNVVLAAGLVRPYEANGSKSGIFGLEDETMANEGVLPPLNAMMAIDMLISALRDGSDTTVHLAGPDMVEYTRDPARMRVVAELMGRAAAVLEVTRRPHTYRVVDINGLERLVPLVTHATQHQLGMARGVVRFDIMEHLQKPCGVSNEQR